VQKASQRNGAVRSGQRYAAYLSVVAALGGLLFGYDTAVISGAIGFLRTHFNLSAAEMGWAASSALVGCIVGAGIAGFVSDFFGRKKALILAATLFGISALWSALAQSVTQFAIARILGGVGVGMASMLSPLYIAEISPASIRGRLVSYNQFAIVTGIFVVYFVNYFIAGLGDSAWNISEGWRWMVGSETLPALCFLLFLVFVPESPRWLVKQGSPEAARAILTRVVGEKQATEEIAAIEDALEHETGSMRQLLQPGVRVALLIGLVLATLQQVTGINVFMYYAPEIFKQLGSGVSAALLQTVVIGAFNVTFTVVAIRTVDRLGRKPLMIIGASGMGLSLFGISFAALSGDTGAWVLVFILTYIASFGMSLGPVVWVVLSEIFPTRIRGRAMGIATLTLWAANYLVSQTFPILNEHPWLVQEFNHAFPFWLYGSMCVVTVLFVWRFVPETKGKSLEEIERLWGIR
jgi:sugar porter (SP) family MFS transporter